MKCGVRVAFGVIVVAAALVGSRLSESLDLLRFPIAWAGVLIALDGAARLRHGASPLRRVGDWLAPAIASVLFWDVFELVDLRLHNWWYTGTSPNPWARAAFAAVSFATVLPAARLFVSLVAPGETSTATAQRRGAEAQRTAENSSGFSSVLSASSPSLRWLLLFCGVAMLAIALAVPRYGFPFAWIFLWPICEAGVRWLPAVTDGVEPPGAGVSQALRWAAIALPMGFLWEGLNWGCARGWIYTVPFFEHPKVFEMPLPGYLGYFPFFLECGAALALVDRLRPFLRGVRGAAAVAAVLVLHVAIDRACAGTSISQTARLAQLRGRRAEVEALAREGIDTPRALLERKPDATDAVARIAAIEVATHMGVPRAERYAQLVGSLAGLAAADPDVVAAAAGDRPAIVRVFVDKAKAAVSR